MSALVIEWEYGSNVIGDFTWVGEEVVVSDKVRECIESRGFSGVGFEPVEMTQRQALKRPRKISKARARVWLPYDGPPLWALLVTSWCHLDVMLSGRSIVTECDVCNRRRMIVHDSKAPLIIKPESWTGTDFFFIREMEKLVFISGVVKQAFEQHGFTNVTMKERGKVPAIPL